YPALHLAKLYRERKDETKEREFADKALDIDAGCIDAWAYLFQHVKQKDGEDKAVEEGGKLAETKKSAAGYNALQGVYANEEETRDKAVGLAKKAVDLNPDEPLALLCLSALYGQKGELEAVIRLLQPHEGKMSRDVRLANNYFEALFQSRQIEKVTKLLN